MRFWMTYFEEILNYFKLKNCWLNSKLYAKRTWNAKNIRICDRPTKLDSLGNLVPLYFSLKFTFLLPLFPGAIVELENSVFQ